MAPPIWDINPVLIQLPFGSLAVRYYGLFFALVFIGGYGLFRWQIRRGQGTDEEAFALIVPGLIGLLVGARLGHILFYNLDYFLANPMWFFRIWEGGLASHGATVGLVLALAWYARRLKKPFWEVCDRFSFSAALGAALVRLGNFFNSEIVGKITDASWAVRFPLYDRLPPDLTPPRYPSQLVEFAIGVGVLFSLWLADRLAGGEKRPQGLLSALFLILYFTGRFLVEFIKERQGPIDHLFLSRGQMLSLPPLAFGLILLAVILLNRKRH